MARSTRYSALHNNVKLRFESRIKSEVKVRPTIQDIKVSAFAPFKTLVIRGDAHGSGDDPYKALIMFTDVDYYSDPISGGVKIQDVVSKSDVWVVPISARNHPVRVRCSCEDFYFIASYWNWYHGALYGVRARTYQRKTRDLPERNPHHVPCMCKHVLALFGVAVPKESVLR